MRVRQKPKSVDTVKAQSLVEVRKPNRRRVCIIVDRFDRFLIVSCCAGCKTLPGFDFDFGSYFARCRHWRMSPFGALRIRCQSGRLHQHSSSDMSCLQVPLQRRKTQVVQRGRLVHRADCLFCLDGGQ